MKRKIIQIAVAGMDTYSRQRTVVAALCDDGSVWQFFEYQGGWYRHPPIPQEPTLPPVAQLRSAA